VINLVNFFSPAGITVDEKYLYVCDKDNNRVQVLDKENGTFIRYFEDRKRNFLRPQSILLHDDFICVGDQDGIQLFTRESNKCVQILGKKGGGIGEFDTVAGICIVGDKLYAADFRNKRIQVWT